MIAFSLLLIPLLYTGRRLHRLEGLVLVGLYSVYLYSLWPK
jgi:cation:H+ antiporter